MSVASVGYNIPVTPVFPSEIRGQTQTVRQSETITRPEPREKQKPQNIQAAAADLQRYGNAFNKKLQFVVDQHSNEVIVKVIDKETDKVIKELPPEELQKLHRNLREAIGLLFDEMA
jgi:flagellar protein FlaG